MGKSDATSFECFDGDCVAQTKLCTAAVDFWDGPEVVSMSLKCGVVVEVVSGMDEEHSTFHNDVDTLEHWDVDRDLLASLFPIAVEVRADADIETESLERGVAVEVLSGLESEGAPTPNNDVTTFEEQSVEKRVIPARLFPGAVDF